MGELTAERLNKVADMIEAYPEHFDITAWISSDTRPGPSYSHTYLMGIGDAAVSADLFECCTTACIAGWACNLWAAEVVPDEFISVQAARILGLDYEVAQDLFVGETSDELTTARKAADHLRRMASEYEQ